MIRLFCAHLPFCSASFRSALTVTVNGTPMKLFLRTMTKDGRLTFGSNTDRTPVTANHSLVFVSAPPL